ncbi:MAG TPA: hydrogenase formation protein HypD [Candidatus Krumholzibacteriaceae bacterium]|nr:hydrogenase formation protein HypD [Candidatus Krumholzibacteriaceae bacterium]
MNVDKLIESISNKSDRIGRKVNLMEVCGTHTMAAFRSGIRTRLPQQVRLLSGPGCPVCVTSDRYIDHAIELAMTENRIITTFGDMMRVPGSRGSLSLAKARGKDIRVIYSPQQALVAARKNPGREVVFLGVGFETTTPLVAWTIQNAFSQKIPNYSVLCAHKTIMPAMRALCDSDDVRVDGFLCPGHVSVITGAEIYQPLCREYHAPCVIAGFEPEDILLSIDMLLNQIISGEASVEIQYTRSVTTEGNKLAQDCVNDVFEPCDVPWRGMGVIPSSGLSVRSSYKGYDAELKFPDIRVNEVKRDTGCRCGDVLRAVITPSECGLFKKECTPDNPIGPCMVSSEGTCAAYYRYSRIDE